GARAGRSRARSWGQGPRRRGCGTPLPLLERWSCRLAGERARCARRRSRRLEVAERLENADRRADDGDRQARGTEKSADDPLQTEALLRATDRSTLGPVIRRIVAKT